MLKDRTELERTLSNALFKLNGNKKATTDFVNNCKTNNNIPKGRSLDAISGRVPLTEFTPFELFVFTKECASKQVAEFFTDVEISSWTDAQFEEEKLTFPLEFKMVKVSDDQLIGVTTTKRIMELRKAQLISFNEDTQRVMQRIVKHGKELWTASVNKAAVAQMAESFHDGVFIPNTITLNLLYGKETDFSYDDKTNTLKIYSLGSFDITDGYHRYLALCQEYDSNPDFDYPMELRITNFDESKAQRMIYQEDQKTKMRKVDSNSFNTLSAAHRTVTKLNESPKFNLQGKINNTDGLINFAEFMSIVDFFYFKYKVNKSQEMQVIIEATEQLTKAFNTITEYDTAFLTKKYHFREMLSIVWLCEKYKGNIPAIGKLNEFLSAVMESDDPKFRALVPRKTLIKTVEKIYDEVTNV